MPAIGPPTPSGGRFSRWRSTAARLARTRSWPSNKPTWLTSRWCSSMSKTKSPAATRRTNKDHSPRRPYRLSPEGLSSLRESARQVMPWRHSTGPRTASGKARSSMNAMKHGERSAERVESRQLVHYALRLLRAEGEAEQRQTEQLTNQEDWI